MKTNRDSWTYNYSKDVVRLNAETMISRYNSEIDRLSGISDVEERLKKTNKDEAYIKWTRALFNRFGKSKKIVTDGIVVSSMYRPYTKKWLYFKKEIIESAGNMENIFSSSNIGIIIQGAGEKNSFSTLITKEIPNFHFVSTGKGFYLKNNLDSGLFSDEYNAVQQFGLCEEDIFYYVYGVLHSPWYLQKYSNDLQKELPRIPLLKNKEKYVEIGRKLADIHLNYENQPIWEGVKVNVSNPEGNFNVRKMKHPKRGILDSIIYNENVTITNIPEEAYEYVVNGRPAIEWIIDQYQVKTDRKSGITDDPNEFSDDPKYILNLLLSIITVSMKTLELIRQLPKFEVLEEIPGHTNEKYQHGNDHADRMLLAAEEADQDCEYEIGYD